MAPARLTDLGEILIRSPGLFREFMHPVLCEMTERISYSLYHLDGPQAIPHLDTLLAVLGQGRALVYEPAFDEPSLRHIRAAYPQAIPLSAEEQKSGGANVLFLSPSKVVTIAENASVNEQLARAGFEVVTLSYSEVIKSGGSVRCDTLPLEREPTSSASPVRP